MMQVLVSSLSGEYEEDAVPSDDTMMMGLILAARKDVIQYCIVRHVTGNDKDYLRKIPRVVW
jgi:hypothetical protein